MQAASTNWKLASKWGRIAFSPFIEIFWEGYSLTAEAPNVPVWQL